MGSQLPSLNENLRFRDAETIINKINNLKILIIGDTIIDEYIYVSFLGKPSKENILSTLYKSTEKKAGGVLTAINILSSFCDNIDFITVMGDNHNDEKFISEYSANNINERKIIKRKYPTTKKTRFVLPGQPVKKLFEIYEMDDQMVDDKIESQILDSLNNKIENYDIVIVQDYGHGLITEKIISTLIAKAKFLAVNAQMNSGNFGYNLITKYHGATYYCLDSSEARMAINSKYETIQKIPSKICKITKGKFVTVTLGKEGSVSCDKSNNIFHSPVIGNQIYDTMSAGDAFYALSAPVLCLSQSIQLSALAGNLAAAIKLETPGLKDSIDKEVFLAKLRLHIKKL